MWMTGLSGSGKSTIARALEEKLVVEMGLNVQNLDGDNVRTGLNRDLGFSPGDRAESVRRVGEMACLFSGGGVITLVTLVSPYREDRDAARKRHEDQGIPFIEVSSQSTLIDRWIDVLIGAVDGLKEIILICVPLRGQLFFCWETDDHTQNLRQLPFSFLFFLKFHFLALSRC